jgi:predicted PurR-regulated permease PerM
MIHRETPAAPAASSPPPAADAGDARSPAPARHTLSDFLRRTLIVAAVAAGTVIVLAALWLEIRALLLGFAGVLVAVMLYRLSGIVSRWTRLPYWAALLAVGVGLLAISAGAAWLMADRIAAQVDSLQTQLPKAWEQLRAYLGGRGWGRWVLQHAQTQWQSASGGGGGWLASGASFLGGVGRVSAEFLVVAFVGLFGAMNPQLYVRGFMHLVPPPHRPRAREVLEALGDVLWWWLVGQFVAMAFIGLVTGVTVWALGVPLALTLGILAALLNFIPNFGPVLSAVPAALLALLVGPMTAVWVIVAYAAIQLLQNHVVTPLVQQEAVQLPAVLLMLAQVFMYYWAGVLGLALAPPLAAAVMKVVQMLYVRDTLGDPMTGSDGFWPAHAEQRNNG